MVLVTRRKGAAPEVVSEYEPALFGAVTRSPGSSGRGAGHGPRRSGAEGKSVTVQPRSLPRIKLLVSALRTPNLLTADGGLPITDKRDLGIPIHKLVDSQSNRHPLH